MADKIEVACCIRSTSNYYQLLVMWTPYDVKGAELDCL